MKRGWLSIITSLVLLVGIAPAAQAVDVRIVDVAEVTWTGAAAPKVTLDQIQTAIKDEVNPQWINFTTFRGEEKSSAISFENGKKTTTPIRLTSRLACDRSDFTLFMNAVRSEVYKVLEIQEWQERHLVVLTPEAGCIWSGRAQVGERGKKGGVVFLHNTAESFVITHELGHNLGLGHTNLMRCGNGKADGKWGDCKAVEYGGIIDVMGNVATTSPLSTYHQWRMGILPKEQIHQSWLNESITLSASDYAKGTRAIFVRDGNTSYWIEYRRAVPEKSINAGLLIYRTDPPPISSVVSPNPADTDASEFGTGVGTDIWMLNLDNFTYSGSKSTGSMTLQTGKSFQFASGNVSLTTKAGVDADQIQISIERAADKIAPPVPTLTSAFQWRYQDSELITSEYDDRESAIDYFEIRRGNEITKLAQSTDDVWFPTYLNPLNPPKMVYLKDLPEGEYEFAIRAVDVWGNRSEWSESRKTVVDRSHPTITNTYQIKNVGVEDFELELTGIGDAGTGLCETRVVNPIGWVKKSSLEKNKPTLKFALNGAETESIEAIDCLGNGVRSELSHKSTFVSVNQFKRTGKWEKASAVYGANALRCIGKCTATTSLAESQNLLLGSSAVDVYVASKLTLKVPAVTKEEIRASQTLDLGKSKKVFRVSGKNFTLIGATSLQFSLGTPTEFEAKAPATDPTLVDPIQKGLSRLGFNSQDFTPDWTVLPMARGTTLADPTLDLCGSDYKSESGRELRRQISVTKVGNPYVFLSSEVVKYKNMAAASAAIEELKNKYAACVKANGYTDNGAFTAHEFKEWTTNTKGLVDEKTHLLVHTRIGTGDTARTLLGFYQFSGEYFTGLYIVSPKPEWFSEQDVERWTETARVIALRMEKRA